jgi:hypothetical protein
MHYILGRIVYKLYSVSVHIICNLLSPVYEESNSLMTRVLIKKMFLIVSLTFMHQIFLIVAFVHLSQQELH